MAVCKGLQQPHRVVVAELVGVDVDVRAELTPRRPARRTRRRSAAAWKTVAWPSLGERTSQGRTDSARRGEQPPRGCLWVAAIEMGE